MSLSLFPMSLVHFKWLGNWCDCRVLLPLYSFPAFDFRPLLEMNNQFSCLLLFEDVNRDSRCMLVTGKRGEGMLERGMV